MMSGSFSIYFFVYKRFQHIQLLLFGNDTPKMMSSNTETRTSLEAALCKSHTMTTL